MTHVLVEPTESFDSSLKRFEKPNARYKCTARAARTTAARRREHPSD